MQAAKIMDADGIEREYAYDDFGGQLYVTDADARQNNPGRPYRPIYSASVSVRSLRDAHGEMWANNRVAQEAIAAERPSIAWRGAW